MPSGWCGTILEPQCAFSGQAGADCRRGDDVDYSDDGGYGEEIGGDGFGGGETQREQDRRIGALWMPWPSPGNAVVHRAGANDPGASCGLCRGF